MKKILSTLLLSSLIIPFSIHALTPPMRDSQTGERLEESLAQKRESRGTSTRQLLQDKELIRSNKLNNASATKTRLASSTKKDFGFCSQIDKIVIQVDGKSTAAEEKRVENLTSREEKRKNIRSEVDIHREENDSKRKAQLEELSRRATTEEQKEAVLAFTTALEKALITKKTATDALIEAHREEIDKKSAARKITIEQAVVTLKADIETAKKKAVSDCATGVQGDDVRVNLKNAIQKAQATFKTTVQPLQKNNDTSKQDMKKQELRTIEETFRKSVEVAKNNLKAAFKKSSSTATTTN